MGINYCAKQDQFRKAAAALKEVVKNLQKLKIPESCFSEVCQRWQELNWSQRIGNIVILRGPVCAASAITVNMTKLFAHGVKKAPQVCEKWRRQATKDEKEKALLKSMD